jgi:dynein heavy chain
VYSICKEFEDIIVRALTVPKSTEELMEMGRYMLYANTTFMEKMKGEVAKMIQQLVQLMDMRSLSQEHIDLNTETVLWLQNMNPVLKQNSLVSLVEHF